jgi:excisionase family DNA binding protein
VIESGEFPVIVTTLSAASLRAGSSFTTAPGVPLGCSLEELPYPTDGTGPSLLLADHEIDSTPHGFAPSRKAWYRKNTFDPRTTVSHQGGDYMTSELAVDVLEAARRLSLGRTRFLELLKDESIPSCLIGGRRVVRTSDLEAYVASLPVSPVGATSGTSAEPDEGRS